ncbi:LysM peptidoglycan-binding domain-containing protein [Amphibacillus sediminis]|uniref:LysM peptidoglycan-binding domain-containing protein n=1 Tax=Amphibacillus sediminis TaxID=360185 RepID=UPI000831A332|nr:LysM peptidoglycan-binding domain-containing protein [Amphibacillus sediminis]
MAAQEDNSAFQFELCETLALRQNEGVAEMLGIGLDPEITIQSYPDYISIRGIIVLTGEYLPADLDSQDTINKPEMANARYMKRVEHDEDGIFEFVHHFPVDISIPHERIKRLDDLSVSIDSFDYRLPDACKLELEATVLIHGLEHQPTKRIKEELPHTDKEDNTEPFDQKDLSEDEPFEFDIKYKEDTQPVAADIKREKADQQEVEASENQNSVQSNNSAEVELVTEKDDRSETTVEKNNREKQLETIVGKNDKSNQPEPITEKNERSNQSKSGIEKNDKSDQAEPITEKNDRSDQSESGIEKNDKSDQAEPITGKNDRSDQSKSGIEKNDRSDHPESANENNDRNDHSELGIEKEEQDAQPEDTIEEANKDAQLEVVVGKKQEKSQSEAKANVSHNSKQASAKREHEQQDAEEGTDNQEDQLDRPTYLLDLFDDDQEDEQRYSQMKMYIVQNDDTLDVIADRYGLNLSQLQEANRLETTSVYQGQVIYVPN